MHLLKHVLFHCSLAAVLAANFGTLAQATDSHPSIKRPFNLAPSAQLSYQVKARQSGIKVHGNSLLKWEAKDKQYQVHAETHAMLIGKIITTTSAGAIDSFGLAPTSSTEKRVRKSTTSANFNREQQTISFTASPTTYPLTGGEQDRTSIVWQLIANARAAPSKFVAGSSWQYFVAGQRDADTWTFRVDKTEKVRTPMGTITAVRVARLLPPNSSDQKLDIWLAPSMQWYPVRLRFAEPDGDYIDQLIERIDRK